MREVFEAWLINIYGAKETTADQYAFLIEKISEDYSKQAKTSVNLYDPIKLDDLKTISALYGKGGARSSFGDEHRGGTRNAIARYVDFLTYFGSFIKGGPCPVYKKSEAKK
jgi:hypothetical protein